MRLQFFSSIKIFSFHQSCYNALRQRSCVIHSKHKKSKSSESKHHFGQMIGQNQNTMSNQAKILTSKLDYKQPNTENIAKFILDGLDKNQKETLIIDADTERYWTGSELKKAIIQLANFLTNECQLKKGDVCSLYHVPDDRVAVCILGIALAGGVTNYLSNSNTARELHDTAAVLKSKILISDHDTLIRIHPNVTDLERNLCIISTSEPVTSKFTKGGLSIQKILQKHSKKIHELDDNLLTTINGIKPDDYSIIQFSSGTTGKPKPIPRTSKNLVHLVTSVDHKEMMDLHPGVVITGSLPITHRPGLWALLASIHCGSTLVIWSHLSDVDSALATIEKFKVTIFSSSLPFLSMLGNVPDKLLTKYNLSSLKHIITSGAKIVNDNLPKKLMVQFNLKSLRQCFGMTESGWVFLIEQTLAKDNYLSVGHVCPSMEARVVDRKTGNSLPANERGEIALRGPQLFPGYLTDVPGQLNRNDFDTDGWFRIGDQGYYDADELFFIEGRYKESMILSNNYMVFPTEIEALISEHSAVKDVCVVKTEVKSDFAYDIAKACITLKHGCKTTEKDILEFLAKRDSQAILMGGVEIFDKFPRLGNGKVDKKTLAKSIKHV